MINISKLLSSIKLELGLMAMATPFDNLDELMREIIVIRTLPVFNEMYPYIVPLQIDTNNLTKVEKRTESTIYMLPDVFGDAEIMMITHMEPIYDNDRYSHDYNTSLFSYGVTPCVYGYQELMLAQAQANMLSAAAKGATFQFIPPNMIEIYSGYAMGNTYRLSVAISHAENLSTIPSTCYTSFLKLATLDVKVYLYNTLIHYDNLSTAYGQLSLNIDRWSGAEDDRRTLIEKWEQTYHLDLSNIYFI
jgi:hypothetical protein